MVQTLNFKVLVAGDGGVGKTTTLTRYIEGVFQEDTQITMGVKIYPKNITFNDKHILLQLWDLGGQEEFRFMHENYTMGVQGAILMVDLTRPGSTFSIEEWVNICRTNNPNLPIILVGNKLDVMISLLDDNYFYDLKKKYDFFDYIKISAKTGENLRILFDLMIEEMIRRDKLFDIDE
jgi:small GTP-binding protein